MLCYLSNELDYSLWFCGPYVDVTAMGGRFSDLEITSDDVYAVMMKCRVCPVVNVHLNYLDRVARREIVINTQHKTIFIDLIKGTLTVNGEIKMQYADAGVQTYIKQHQAVLDNEFHSFCTYAEGMQVVKLIDTIEKAANSKKWINQ